MDRREFYSNLADSREALEHAEGFQKANHKYVNRFRGRNGKWIYEYAEDLKEKANATAAKAKKSLDSAGNDAKKTLVKTKTRVSKGVNMASKFGSAKLKDLSKASGTAIAKGKYHLANLKNKVEKPTAPEEWKNYGKYQREYETEQARMGKARDRMHKIEAGHYTSDKKADRKERLKSVQNDYSVVGNANKQRQFLENQERVEKKRQEAKKAKEKERKDRIEYKKEAAREERLGTTYDKALDSVYVNTAHNNNQSSMATNPDKTSREFKEDYVSMLGTDFDKEVLKNLKRQEDRDKLLTARKRKEAAAHRIDKLKKKDISEMTMDEYIDLTFAKELEEYPGYDKMLDEALKSQRRKNARNSK